MGVTEVLYVISTVVGASDVSWIERFFACSTVVCGWIVEKSTRALGSSDRCAIYNSFKSIKLGLAED